MKFTVISILAILFVLPLVSALEFSFNYPESVGVNENFTASLSASTSESYDVKIFVQDNSSSVILSEIYNDGWKNPFYYIKSVFPAKTEFLLRAKNYSDNAVICARLRRIGSSSYSEKCGSISLEKSATSSSSSHKETNSSSSKDENITVVSTTNTANADFTPSAETQTAKSDVSSQSSNSERIVLTPKKSSSSEFVTSEEKLRLFAVYAFTGLVIIIVILLAFKKL